MKKSIVFIAVAALFFLVVNPVSAQVRQWEFDRAHSSIAFNIKHIYSTVRGDFEDYDGSFLFDPENLDGSGFNIEIKVQSVNTKVRKRDNHLRSGDFFAAGQYPLMRFESTRIRHVDGDRFAAEGRLTIKDVTKEIALPFAFLGMRENPFDKDQLVAGFESRFTIDRLEYHVGTGKFHQMGVAGKDVEIVISLEMIGKK